MLNDEQKQYRVTYQAGKVVSATYFDLARCVSRDLNIVSDGKGIIIRQRTSTLNIRRKNVLRTYRAFDKVFCPSLGTIETTRLGWRHMFRAGRSVKHKKTSLNKSSNRSISDYNLLREHADCLTHLL